MQPIAMLRASTAALTVLALLAARPSSGKDQKAASFEPSLDLVERPVQLHLADYLSVADLGRELARISFADTSERRYLSSGWNRFQDSGTDAGSAWTGARNAVIDVHLVAPEPLSIRLEVAAPADGFNLPEQRLQIFWNSRRVGSFPLQPKWQEVEVRVPRKLQRVGPNRMELRPSYWLNHGPSDAGRRVIRGVQCRSIEFTSARPQIGGSNPGALASGDSILQDAGSVITYYLVLPEKAVLRGEGKLSGGSHISPSDLPGQLLVSLLDAEGRERTIVSRHLADLSRLAKLALQADLSDLAGRMVALSLSFSLPTTGQGEHAPPLQVEWQNLRIEGVRRELGEKRVAGFRGRYNVLVILFDTLRADHTEPYGSVDVRTPAMTRLSTGGVTFVNAFSNSSFTRTAVASLFTSLYPFDHQVLGREHSLPTAPPSLPQILQEHGFGTLAIINNSHVAPVFGFGRGFDQVHEIYPNAARVELRRKHKSPREHAEFVWQTYIEPFVQKQGDRPFFVYLHEIDPHGPYAPIPPYDRMYDLGYRGSLTRRSYKVLNAINRGAIPVDEADIRYLLSQYDGEVSFMDAYLGWILDRLAETRLEEKTLVVFLSDHGEEFMEHGRLTHEVDVYENLLRVPLLFSLQGVLPRGRRPQASTELMDVAPTILDLLGEEIPATMQGQSLLPYLTAPDSFAPDRATYAKVGVQVTRDSVRFGDWKLIQEVRTDRAQQPGRFFLFNLQEDPDELIDRWAQELVVGKTLRQMLEWQYQNRTARDAGEQNRLRIDELDPKVLENLRLLGYVD